VVNPAEITRSAKRNFVRRRIFRITQVHSGRESVAREEIATAKSQT
jgi:hypothetical protein